MSRAAKDSFDAGPNGAGEILDLAQEARRQSLLVGRRRSEKETLELIEQLADTLDWK